MKSPTLKKSAVFSIKEKISSFFETATQDMTSSLVRLETEIDPIDLLTWVGTQPRTDKWYWSDREDGWEAAGVGIADIVFSTHSLQYQDLFNHIQSRLTNKSENSRYYGGISFETGGLQENSWAQFGRFRFVLPLIEIVKTPEKTMLACNILQNKGRSLEELKVFVLDQLDQMTIFDEYEPEKASIQSRVDMPDEEKWGKSVESILNSIEMKRYEKCVLARKTTLELDKNLDPFALLSQLKPNHANAYGFAFQMSSKVSFVGISPECLLKQEGRKIYTEAIAGTRKRGETEQEDERLGKELLNSEKDLLEHQQVLQLFDEKFKGLCDGYTQQSQPSLLKLTHVQHLQTKIEGYLKPEVTSEEVLEALHPTPAVCGYPREAVLPRLPRLESFERGWYCGNVGWISKDKCHLAVAIRSALIEGSKLQLFSGAGIVEGSQKQDEWQELEDKIQPYLELLS